MAEEKLCVRFLRAAAARVRQHGLARGVRIVRGSDGRVSDTPILGSYGPIPYGPAIGSVCMLGAMNYCGVEVGYSERLRIEQHLNALLPTRNGAFDPYNPYNSRDDNNRIAWWSNTQAKDADEVATMFEKAAETC